MLVPTLAAQGVKVTEEEDGTRIYSFDFETAGKTAKKPQLC